MSKLIRRTVGMKKSGAALLAALQIISLILIGFLLPFGSGPQQHSADVNAGPGTNQAHTETQTAVRQPLTAADKRALRASAILANKLYEPLATQVFNLATARAAAAVEAQNTQSLEAPNEQPTLTTNREDYPHFSYVYFHGTGFQPGETVNMTVVKLSADRSSFKPWNIVADTNGEFDTSW